MMSIGVPCLCMSSSEKLRGEGIVVCLYHEREVHALLEAMAGCFHLDAPPGSFSFRVYSVHTRVPAHSRADTCYIRSST